MSMDFLNNQIQLDDFSSDDYLQEIISPSSENRTEKIIDSQELKYNPLLSYVEQSIPYNIQMNNLLPNMHRISSPIIQQNSYHPQMLNVSTSNMQAPMIMVPIQIVQKRKIAETTSNLQVSLPNNDELYIDEEDEDSLSPSTKKSKKSKSKKNKKDIPKRKRVNYCFEIHRSGCALNKDAKLYCKVFLKGKLQSEVDLIKGARGKWAYTFYDQRKKKKERRYWPSQSSGPIIEDPCNCDKCIPSTSTLDEEVDFSSPSTEENSLNEYENKRTIQMIKNEYKCPQPQQIIMAAQYGNQIVYYPTNFHPSEVVQDQYNQYVQLINPEFSRNLILKSSNDFQDNRASYLRSSNDFVNHQRPWEVNNNPQEYGNDGFFVENTFL